MLTDLIAIAEQLLSDRYVPQRHAVASALRASSGQVFVGLHIGGTVARVSLCAEAVALSQAIMVGCTDLDTIVTVHRASGPDSDSFSKLVNPCGMCRELLSDYAPNLRVIVPDGSRSPFLHIPICDLLPRKFTRP